MPPGPAPDRAGRFPAAAIVLAGGGSRRLGADKPELVIDGRRLLDTVLAAVAGARVVVVGPERTVPAGVGIVREDPPGGGPAAGLAAGLAALQAFPTELVAVLAADLPGITAQLVARLADLVARSGAAGALAVDDQGHRQLLVGVWLVGPLEQAIAARGSWHGARLRDVLEPLSPALLTASAVEISDIDTGDDLHRWERRRRSDPETE